MITRHHDCFMLNMNLRKIPVCTVDVILIDFGGVLAEEGFREGLRAIAKNHLVDKTSFIRDLSDFCPISCHPRESGSPVPTRSAGGKG